MIGAAGEGAAVRFLGAARTCYGARMNFLRASFLVVASALSFGFIYACGGGEQCGPANCLEGCCDAEGTCQTGTVQTACGVAGQACQSCDAQSICQGGVCTSFGGGDNVNTTCLQTCTGCCRNGQCSSGDTEQACGRGEACVTCADGQVCLEGACTLPGCDGCRDTGGNCNEDGLTSAQACGRDGVVCRACPSGSTCVDGSCTGCNGCYDGLGRCRPGTMPGACGSGGDVCATCAMGTVCQNGACQVTCKSLGAGCLAGAECCSGTCENGSCATPPAGDGGTDGGTDGGSDAGTDAGTDGGSCKSNGAGCLVALECCSGACTSGVCGTGP